MQTVRYGEEQVWEGRRTTVGPTMAGEVQGKFFFNTLHFGLTFFVLFSSHAFVGDGYMLVVVGSCGIQNLHRGIHAEHLNCTLYSCTS